MQAMKKDAVHGELSESLEMAPRLTPTSSAGRRRQMCWVQKIAGIVWIVHTKSSIAGGGSASHGLALAWLDRSEATPLHTIGWENAERNDFCIWKVVCKKQFFLVQAWLARMLQKKGSAGFGDRAKEGSQREQLVPACSLCFPHAPYDRIARPRPKHA
jgi:hypothetical protein